jgi:hypothetical protein
MNSLAHGYHHPCGVGTAAAASLHRTGLNWHCISTSLASLSSPHPVWGGSGRLCPLCSVLWKQPWRCCRGVGAGGACCCCVLAAGDSLGATQHGSCGPVEQQASGGRVRAVNSSGQHQLQLIGHMCHKAARAPTLGAARSPPVSPCPALCGHNRTLVHMATTT